MNVRIGLLLVAFVSIRLLTGCANISVPTGGKKDTIAPKLVFIDPKDSMLQSKVKKIEMYFDEYITVSDAINEVQVSPIISIPPTVIGINKKIIVKIVDSLLDSNTTYRISFGKAIKDLHEGNPFKKYTYTFSTGKYFDSLQLVGSVVNAETGLPDTGGVTILLYNANVKDSEVIKHKPKYITKIDNKGVFQFKGLPRRKFRIYALKETNNNLIYDGIGEKIAFNDSFVTTGDTLQKQILLRLFSEKVDTGLKKTDTVKSKRKTDSLTKKQDSLKTAKITAKKKNKHNDDATDSVASRKNFRVDTLLRKTDSMAFKADSLKLKKKTDTVGKKNAIAGKHEEGKSRSKNKDEPLSYAINIDTSRIDKRSFDYVHNVIKISFNKKHQFFKEKVSLSYLDDDSAVMPVPFVFEKDSAKSLIWKINVKEWKDNTVYILKMPKGFAKDTAGNDVLPSKYCFRTLQDDDYGKLKINLPNKYFDTLYILRINNESDSFYQKKVTDTVIELKQLKPGKYSMRIIVDKNGNGIWDTGDLLAKKQPEIVIPYIETITVKAGWEMIVDFEPKPTPKKDKPDTKSVSPK